MRTTLSLFLLLCFSLCSFQACSAADFLRAGQNITGSTSLLVSAGQTFILGFFSPPKSPTESYLGIWYNQTSYPGKLTVVWVANRNNPVVSSKGVFRIASNGDLQVTSTSGGIFWTPHELEGSSSSRNRTVKLLDSGNLVLIDDQDDATGYIWQSFLHPTDTFLPGMEMDTDIYLISWSTGNDPRKGNYTFTMMSSSTEDNRYVIWKNSAEQYWDTSSRNLNSGRMFLYVDFLLRNSNLTTDTDPYGSRKKAIGHRKPPPCATNYSNTRIVMNYTGHLQFLAWDSFLRVWFVRWNAPDSFCDVYNACGRFTSCNANHAGGKPCRCLPGFSEVVENECARKSEATSCEGGTTRFLNMGRVKTGSPNEELPAENESECQRKCLHMCSKCQAYSYVAAPIDDNNVIDTSCWIWTLHLDTLQEEDEDDDGSNLFVRVDKSDIEPTPRTCEPCGTKAVPYPLSTGENCGDRMYFNFICNNSTAQLSFFAATTTATTSSSNDTYTVVSIDVESKMFVIQADTDRDCESSRPTIRLPFNVNDDCLAGGKVEVSWQPPPEPICTKSADCEGWNHSSCKETKEGIKRCLCNSHYHWDVVHLNCIKIKDHRGPKATWLIVAITLTSVVILACAIIFAYVRRRKINLKKEKKSNQRNRERFRDSVRHVKNLIEAEGLEEEDNERIEVPYFDFESILEATDNFSDANKLGKGGYGPVYKGKLQSGEVVAVKRLSSVSSQGLQEFKNEVVLIAKLQHRNLVRLRGYCIKGNEKILLYEHMHNRSLDSFIFDPTKSLLLDWQMRFDIILGIARGMLYLHHDSRLRVIHRDLKTSNILLDEEMQPKISDFGLAKIVAGKETEANTTRVVGTFGYMSPEYALDGLFSIKSDVFSFGVVVLEIISGKKNTRFYNSELFSSLLSYAWTLWTENRLLDLMDTSLGESCNTNQFIVCTHIGLLCVQDEPGDRPTMSNVVTLLDSETSSLPTPKEPTFFRSRGQSITTTSSRPEISMQFESSSQEVE